MANDYFNFKRFTVRQAGAAMKVGTDGVLLGAWADISARPAHILDVGTGTGLIALMLAQRCGEWSPVVDGVEIDSGSAEQARQNAAESPWSGSVNIYHDDFARFSKGREKRYDLVVVNPPFFNGSLHSPDTERTMARHTRTLSYDSLVFGAGRVLKDDGILSLIIPVSEEEYMMRTAFLNGFCARRKTYVSTLAGMAPKRLLVEFSKGAAACVTGRMVIEDSVGVYGGEYVDMTRDFYLKF